MLLRLAAGISGALVALSVGQNLSMLFVLDGNAKRKEEKQRYMDEYGLANERAITISAIIADGEVIEDLLDDEARQIISDKLELSSKKSTKNQIRSFFQEGLAKDEIIPLGNGFKKKAQNLISEPQKRINLK
ncbi:hypothetical protein RLOatenuis_6300 [Rickettsiales bacterium]|nr:hypothetical protein RLOatenuis_6300 [Rickettsiales bacterium]